MQGRIEIGSDRRGGGRVRPRAIASVPVWLGLVAGTLAFAAGPSAVQSAEDAAGAGPVCEEAAPQAAAPRVRDRSCHLSPAVVRRLHAAGELTVVDVRQRAAYREYRIPGSLNLPLFSVKTKRHLRGRPVLLIHEGYAAADLEAECLRLRSDGFESLGLLRGGLRTWRDAIGPLEGDLRAQQALERLPHRALARELGFDDWLVVDVAPEPAGDVGTLLPGAARVPFVEPREAFSSRLVGTLEQRVEPAAFVAIVDRDGSSYGPIAGALRGTPLPSVYFLEGGLDGWRSFRAQQTVVASRRARPWRDASCSAR